LAAVALQEAVNAGRSFYQHAVFPCFYLTSWHSVLLQEALDAGHAFYLSSNAVLLCEGPLPVQFVEELQQQEVQQLWISAEPTGE
jgi:hypothetical protein